MNSTLKKLMIVLCVLLPIIIIAALTFYMQGVKRYGTPSEYRQYQEERQRAIQDSISKLNRGVPPENLGDSIMVGLDKHTDIFTETQKFEDRISTVKSTLDSIQLEKDTLETLLKEVIEQQNVLKNLRQRELDEKITNLAKIYDNMNFQRSVPLIIAMDDTLAMLLLSRMQQRNAAKLLGALAEVDVEKATRINKLLSLMDTKAQAQ